jgi:hypothetical protein
VPVNSNLQNLSIDVVLPATPGGDISMNNISGAGFKGCLNRWYSYDPSSSVAFHSDGTTTGSVNIFMPTEGETVQTTVTGSGIFVDANLSSGPTTTPYTDAAGFYDNCAELGTCYDAANCPSGSSHIVANFVTKANCKAIGKSWYGTGTKTCVNF